MAESKDIRFSRLYLKVVEEEVLKHFASSVLAAAKVRKLYKQGGKQYWEFYVPAVNGFAKAHRIEVKAGNAYEAKANAWNKLLEKLGLEDKGEGAAVQ